MAEYLITLVTVSIVCGIVSILSPKGDTGKYVSFICGVCILGIMVDPIADVIKNFDGLSDSIDKSFVEDSKEYYENIFKDNLKKESVEQAEQMTEERLSADLNIERESFAVQLLLEDNTVKKAVVTIFPSGISIDTGEVIGYIEAILKCPCVIIYDDSKE